MEELRKYEAAARATWWGIRLCFVVIPRHVWDAIHDPAGTWMSLRIMIHRYLYLFYQQVRGKRSIAVCTSSNEANVKSLITQLSNELNNDVIVKYVELPYNDVDYFFIDEREHDTVILCHSIHNRRFAVTDVLDALYDKFLPTVARIFGKENVAVIAHDFTLDKIDSEGKYQPQIDAFRARQPTTFENASLVLVAGKIDSSVEFPSNGWDKLKRFIEASGKLKLASKD